MAKTIVVPMACFIGGQVDNRFTDRDTCEHNGGDWLPRDGRVPDRVCVLHGQIVDVASRRECRALGGRWVRSPVAWRRTRRTAKKASRKKTAGGKRRKKTRVKSTRVKTRNGRVKTSRTMKSKARKTRR